MSKADELLGSLNEAKISDKDEKKFVEYVYSFYSPKVKDSLYPVKSLKDLDKAIEIYMLAVRAWRVSWGGGDT